MIGGPGGSPQLPARPWVRTGFLGLLGHFVQPSSSWNLDSASAASSALPLPWHTLQGSDTNPRPRLKAGTACGAALGAVFHQCRSGSTEVNRVQVHFSNICKLLSVTAKSKPLGEETRFLVAFLFLLALAHFHSLSCADGGNLRKKCIVFFS